MGFWEQVNQELKRAVEDGWSAVKENAKVGKLKLSIHGLHRDAERHFKDIGGIVYDMASNPSENPLHNPEVQGHLGEIRRLEAEVRALEAEIARLKFKETSSGT